MSNERASPNSRPCRVHPRGLNPHIHGQWENETKREGGNLISGRCRKVNGAGQRQDRIVPGNYFRSPRRPRWITQKAKDSAPHQNPLPPLCPSASLQFLLHVPLSFLEFEHESPLNLVAKKGINNGILNVWNKIDRESQVAKSFVSINSVSSFIQVSISRIYIRQARV